MHYTYVIIGGGITGVTVAETIRAHDARGSIAIISDEPHMLYSRVLLPSYIKKRIPREKVFLRSLGDYDSKNIALFAGELVTKIDTVQKKIFLESGRTIFFGKLCIASGGAASAWSITGARGKRGIFHLQTLDDADAILGFLPEMKKAIVIGGGFIALEFLEFFFTHQIPITLLCRNKNFFGTTLDGDGIRLMHANFEKHKISFMFGDEVRDMLGGDLVEGMITKQNVKISGNVIGLGVGLSRRMEFLEGSGVEKGGRGITTDEYLATNVADVWAAGDVAEFYDTVVGKHHVHGTWTNAFLQGEIAGLNMLGQKKPFRKVPSYSLANLGLHITFLGETDPEESEETVSRNDSVMNRYERFFLKEDRIIGAVLINMFQDKPYMTKLIEERVPITPYKEKLFKMNFDLHSISL